MPTAFGEIIGHGVLVRLLESWLQAPAPAYLLTGPTHVGKRTLSESFVKKLLGLDIADPAWKNHPDLVLLEPEEGKTQISVEQVRAARERLGLRPMVAPRLVAYLPCADRLNESGTNALLKILEEPPAGAVFVMIAEDLGRIPATVRSRSVNLAFGIVPKAEIIEALKKRGLEAGEAERRATAARGRPGLALEPIASGGTGARFAGSFLSAQSVGERLALVEELSRSCESEDDQSAAWRDGLTEAMRAASSGLSEDPDAAMVLGLALLTAWRSVGTSVSPRFPLEAAAVRLSRQHAGLASLFPSHLPSPFPLVYNT